MPAYAQRVASDLKKIGIDCKRQDLHLGAVLRRRLVRRQGQARPVALDRLRHRRLRQPPGAADLPERRAQVGRRVERRALRQQGVRQDDRELHGRDRRATQKKYAKAMESQLLKDTPAIYAYFYNFIAGASTKVKGYVPGRRRRRRPAEDHHQLGPLARSRSDDGARPRGLRAHGEIRAIRTYIAQRLAFGVISLLPADDDRLCERAGAARRSRPRRCSAARRRPPPCTSSTSGLGYYDPLPVRYLHWLGDVAHGDFGASYTDGRPVTDDLVPGAPEVRRSSRSSRSCSAFRSGSSAV